MSEEGDIDVFPEAPDMPVIPGSSALHRKPVDGAAEFVRRAYVILAAAFEEAPKTEAERHAKAFRELKFSTPAEESLGRDIYLQRMSNGSRSIPDLIAHAKNCVTHFYATSP